MCAVEVACPGCGVVSRRVHSRYQRRLADTASGCQEVLICLQARRFFCSNDACAKATFAEQVPGLTTRYGRRTCGLEGTLQAIALALGGRAGARLSSRLACSASRSTLLRLIRAAPDMSEIELSAGTIEYQDTDGDGPVLVLLHGLMMDASLWDGPIAGLSADHRCVAPTLPLGAHRRPMRADADLSLPCLSPADRPTARHNVNRAGSAGRSRWTTSTIRESRRTSRSGGCCYQRRRDRGRS
jgi:zinc-finger of transposase IS204/IS1001/IS1096/IS1165